MIVINEKIRTVRIDSLWHIDLNQRLLNKLYKEGPTYKTFEE